MAKRDLIIAFFSQPSKSTDPDRMVYGSAWKEGRPPPFVYAVPDKYSCPGLTRAQGPRPCPDPNDGSLSCNGSVVDECSGSIRDFGFATSVAEHIERGGGSPLAYYTNQASLQSGGDTWDRIAVVTFSAGHSGARQLMQIDGSQIDTYISLDSLTLAKDGNGKFLYGAGGGQGVGTYAAFGIGGFDASAMSILLHTDITTPGRSSTKESAVAVFNELHKVWADMNNALTNPAEGFGWLVPTYREERLVEGPRYWWPRDASHPDPIVEDRVGNNFRIHLPTNVNNQINGHRACGADFQRGIFDTFLMPRWNNPELFSCVGDGCIQPFSKDPPLSGFGRYSGMGAVTAPTTKSADMDALIAQWEAAGLPRWDILLPAAALVGGVTLAGLAAYYALR